MFYRMNQWIDAASCRERRLGDPALRGRWPSPRGNAGASDSVKEPEGLSFQVHLRCRWRGDCLYQMRFSSAARIERLLFFLCSLLLALCSPHIPLPPTISSKQDGLCALWCDRARGEEQESCGRRRGTEWSPPTGWVSERRHLP